MAGQLDAVARVAYRALMRSARIIDESAALKALVTTRDLHANQMPDDLKAALNVFFGSEDPQYFVPSNVLPQSVCDTMRTLFRWPPPDCTRNTAFAAIRYTDALLHIGREHKLAGPTSAADEPVGHDQQAAERPQVLALPEPGCLLLAHPLLEGARSPDGVQATFSFARSAVLVCSHSTSLGAFGITLNKPLLVRAGALTQDSPLLHALFGDLLPWPPAQADSNKAVERWRAMCSDSKRWLESQLPQLLEVEDGTKLQPSAMLQRMQDRQSSNSECSSAGQEADEVQGGRITPLQQPAWSGSDYMVVQRNGRTNSNHVLSKAFDACQNRDRRHHQGSPTHDSGSGSNSDDISHSSSIGNPHIAAGSMQGRGDGQELCDLNGCPDDSFSAAQPAAAAAAASDVDARQQAASSGGSSSRHALLDRFVGGSLSKGGPLPAIQVLHQRPALGGVEVLPPITMPDGSSGSIFLGVDSDVSATCGSRGEAAPRTVPSDDEGVHLFIGECEWQPGNLEAEIAAGSWICVTPPQQVRRLRDLGSLWRTSFVALGPPMASLAAVTPKVRSDLAKITF